MRALDWTRLEEEIIPEQEELDKDSYLVSDVSGINGLRTILYYFPMSMVLLKKVNNTNQTWWYQVELGDVKF